MFSSSEDDSVFSSADLNPPTPVNGKGGKVKKGSADSALTLKRLRDLDVDSAKAEWRVADGVIVVFA